MEKISVIVPVYKVEKYLRKCLDNIVNQTYSNLEIIVVDDGSPDNSGNIADEYAAKDNRVKVIHKENGGLSDARNTGLAVATGEYVTFCDSDDIPDVREYEVLYNLIKKYDADISFCELQRFCEGDEIIPMEPSCCYQLSENYESGGAGLVSCTEDYAAFADVIACGGITKDGVRIIKPETIEIMKKNLLGEASMEDIANKMGRKGYGYGCGVQVLVNPELINAKAPAGVFGWDGAAGSCIIMNTKTKTSLVYTQHVRNCGFAYDTIHPTLRDFVFGE